MNIFAYALNNVNLERVLACRFRDEREATIKLGN